jgi:polysaccharide biosynthesis transport protein
MDRSPETRTLSDLLRVLRSRYRIILLTTLVAAGAALGVSLMQSRTYEATATVALTPDFFVQGDEAVSVYTAGIGLANSDKAYRRTSRALGGSPGPQELRSDVTSSFRTGSTVLDIYASSSSADEAARIANEFADAIKVVGEKVTKAAYVRQARVQNDPSLKKRAKSVDPVQVVQTAPVPASPTSPKPARNAFIGACLGLIIGLFMAFLRQAMDRRVSNAEELRRGLDLPLLGYVRKQALGRVGMFANGTAADEETDLDSFRILRAKVDFLGGDTALKAFAVTSPLPEEGKSTVSAGLAYANALAGRKTILVECDLRRPTLAERLDFEASPGLQDRLTGDAKVSELTRTVTVEGLSAEPLRVIPAGLEVRQPAELISSPRFREFLTAIRKEYEVVILDCPPLLPVGDTLELLPQVDGVLLCLRVGQTTYEQARGAKQAIEHLPKRPTGLVITGVSRGTEQGYYGSYYSSRTHTPVAD